LNPVKRDENGNPFLCLKCKSTRKARITNPRQRKKRHGLQIRASRANPHQRGNTLKGDENDNLKIIL